MKNYLQENYEAYAKTLPGQQWQWLSALRQQALAQFMEQGFPTIRNEDWKYTNLQRLERQPYVLDSNNKVISQELNIPVFSKNSHLVFIDGHFQKTLSKISTDIQFLSFAEAAETQSKLLENYLQQSISVEPSSLTALNLCAATDGAVIHIAEKTQPSLIELVFYSTEQEQNLLIQHRNIIICDAHSDTTIIEHYCGATTAENLTNSVTEVHLKAHARLHHIKLQVESVKAVHIGNLSVQQEDSSYLKSHVLSYDGNLVRNEIYTGLNAQNAETQLFGLFLAQKYQHMDQHTFIDHAKPHCNSNQLYRGILMDNARGVFNGKVLVRPDAQKTCAHQKNNNLLLSANAEIDTKPELQIYADDVQCSHGATVGQLDEHALFYLRARGITLDQARSLMIYAFAAEVLQSVPDLNLRHVLQQQLLEYLPVTAWLQEVCHE